MQSRQRAKYWRPSSGVSGIEEGDANLGKERSLKTGLGLSYTNASGRLTLNGRLFYQRVEQFINLEPDDEFRLTIRGAFPVFRYRGVDAEFIGANFTLLAQVGDRLDLDSRLAILRARERGQEENRNLVFIPPANWRNELTYRLPRDFEAGVSAYFAFRKTGIDPDQDFLPPPPGYALFDWRIGRDWVLGRRTLGTIVSIENLLDTRYRDYLDRQRYFADAPGRSVNLRLRLEL